jgi:hypothetical protein
MFSKAFNLLSILLKLYNLRYTTYEYLYIPALKLVYGNYLNRPGGYIIIN